MDLNGDDVAQGQRTWNADGTYTDCKYLDPGCEINLTGIARILGLEADNTALHHDNTGLRTRNADLRASNTALENDNTALRAEHHRRRNTG